MINFGIYGFTQKEKIQETLSKLGVKQALIDETVALDYEIRDTQYFENDEIIIRERVQKLEKLLQKDERNYIASQALITIFESKISGDYKKYLDLFVKYTPYEYEKTFSKMMYALDQGDISSFEKYMYEIPKKYNDTVVVTLAKIFVAKNFDEKQMLTEKVLKLLKNESVNEEIQNYNLRAEVILYFNVVIMNEEIKEDLLKISNGAKLEDTWIAKKIQKETEKDKDFLSKMVN